MGQNSAQLDVVVIGKAWDLLLLFGERPADQGPPDYELAATDRRF